MHEGLIHVRLQALIRDISSLYRCSVSVRSHRAYSHLTHSIQLLGRQPRPLHRCPVGPAASQPITFHLVEKASLVTLAKGVHPVPSRTRQLSPSAPMVVGAQAPARVGHRQRSFFAFNGKPERKAPAADPSGPGRPAPGRRRKRPAGRFDSQNAMDYTGSPGGGGHSVHYHEERSPQVKAPAVSKGEDEI